MTPLDTMKQALEALEKMRNYGWHSSSIWKHFYQTSNGDYVSLSEFQAKAKPTAAALRRAIADLEQAEPVATNNKQPEALRLAAVLEEATDFYFESSSMQNGGLVKAVDAAADQLRRLETVNAQLLAALNAMLTHMGMDEDEWNKPTFDQARAAIAAAMETE